MTLFPLSLEPQDGHWGRWSSWTDCTQSCGQGMRTRTRACEDPAPKYGGKDCVGTHTDSMECFVKPCGLGKFLHLFLNYNDKRRRTITLYTFVTNSLIKSPQKQKSKQSPLHNDTEKA